MHGCISRKVQSNLYKKDVGAGFKPALKKGIYEYVKTEITNNI